ncbi:MAG: MATE family efflux transporter [Oscillospiraceae bacterium]|nr:MATE family efflux transporter [Oscillospiraceae bacterium]
MKDLTVGKPLKTIWQFSLPLLLSTALQQLYNIADSVIVGQYTGATGLAAIGAAYPITLFYIAIATGSAMGCSVIISQLFGAKRFGDLKTAVFTALLSLLGLGVALSLIGILLAGPLMRLLNAPTDLYPYARSYLAIYSAGVVFMFLYNAATSIFTGLGDSRRPLYFLIASSVLNVFLDILAVGPLNLGVAGAAWATTISQAAAAALSCTLAAKRVMGIQTDEPHRHFDLELLKPMAGIAVPSIFQQCCVALSHTILQGLVNSFDTAVIAGYEAASKLHNFAYMCFNTLGTALSSFVAQCYGAKKYDRIIRGFWVSTGLCFAFTLVVIAVFQLFPVQLAGIFVEEGTAPDVIAVSVNYLRIISPVYSIICFIITTGGLLRGVGKSMTFFVETVIEFVVRVVMCFVLTKALSSYTGLMWAWYFGSPCGFLMCMALFLRERKRLLARNDLLGHEGVLQ